ncbi:MAG: TetR/AcrR family transcriptional regulator [Tateyamaria sp.]|uniref:TetR/AcrR family transcriptional regulator n=1 Tax=Tateyamaria sp. TaxID=1929288 RepID=UPI00329A9A52
MEAGEKIIATKGLRELTVRQIGTAIGYSAGSVYNVFRNLDDLISHINARTLRALETKIAEVQETGDVHADAKSVLQVYSRFQAKHSKLWAANNVHAMRQDIEQAQIYDEALEAVVDCVVRIVSPGLPNRSDKEVRKSVRVLWASLLGIASVPASARFLKEGGYSVDLMAEDLVEHYLRGLIAEQDDQEPHR